MSTAVSALTTPTPEPPVAVLDRKPRARFWVPPTWEGSGGVRELLTVAGPLILSFGVHSLNMFFGRLMLAHYSPEHFAAALQGAVTWWAMLAIPFGVVMYISTFVAQHAGAKENEKIGPIVWQGAWIALFGAAWALLTTAFALPFFQWIGHDGQLPVLEATYFSILGRASLLMLLVGVFNGFFSGRGKTWFVLKVSLITLSINIGLDYWFIFHGGPGGIVPKGIAGAAIATVIANAVEVLILVTAFLLPGNARLYNTRGGWRPNVESWKRIFRFGGPSGLHSAMDMIAFTVFVLVVGLWGTEAQLASNVAIQINALLFIPAIGLHHGCCILSGQAVGAGRPDVAEKSNCSAMILSLAYFALTIVLIAAIPGTLVDIFLSQRGGAGEENLDWAMATAMAKILLVFVCIYSIADGVQLVFAGTIKGAGDTKFVMLLTLVCSQLFMAIPCILFGVYREHFTPRAALLACWSSLTLFVVSLAVAYTLRYRNGAWLRMSVIHDKPAA